MLASLKRLLKQLILCFRPSIYVFVHIKQLLNGKSWNFLQEKVLNLSGLAQHRTATAAASLEDTNTSPTSRSQYLAQKTFLQQTFKRKKTQTFIRFIW